MIVRKKFDNFFIVESGVARDLGNQLPARPSAGPPPIGASGGGHQLPAMGHGQTRAALVALARGVQS